MFPSRDSSLFSEWGRRLYNLRDADVEKLKYDLKFDRYQVERMYLEFWSAFYSHDSYRAWVNGMFKNAGLEIYKWRRKTASFEEFQKLYLSWLIDSMGPEGNHHFRKLSPIEKEFLYERIYLVEDKNYRDNHKRLEEEEEQRRAEERERERREKEERERAEYEQPEEALKRIMKNLDWAVNYHTKLKTRAQLFKIIEIDNDIDFIKSIPMREEIYNRYKEIWEERNPGAAEQRQREHELLLQRMEQQRIERERLAEEKNRRDLEIQAQRKEEARKRKEDERAERLAQRFKPSVPDTFTLPYMFKDARKRKLFTSSNPNAKFIPEAFEQIIPDKKLKPLKSKFMRPNFGINPYTWEMDHLQYQEFVSYLFFINVNTRYLYAFPVHSKSNYDTARTFNVFLNAERDQFNHPVKHIRADGDRGFIALKHQFPAVEFYLQGSPFTFHNKQVDAVMRTLRDALGPGSDDLWNGSPEHDRVIQQLIYQYNNTWHRSIRCTPMEMHTDEDAEWKYIREMTEELNKTKRRQRNNGLHAFKPGDRVMVHLDGGKTNLKFEKRRRVFDRLAQFVKYSNGNAIVQLEGAPGQGLIEVPIFCVAKPLMKDQGLSLFRK